MRREFKRGNQSIGNLRGRDGGWRDLHARRGSGVQAFCGAKAWRRADSLRPSMSNQKGSPAGLPAGDCQPDTLTPIEAMGLLYELKQKLN